MDCINCMKNSAPWALLYRNNGIGCDMAYRTPTDPAKVRHGIQLRPLDGYVELERLARDLAKKRLVTVCAIIDKELFHIRPVLV